MTAVAIVGLGSYGLCVLERLVAAGEDLGRGVELEVHVIEPARPGSGVFDPSQPDYLLLNTPCSQLSLDPFGATRSVRAEYGLNLHQWAVRHGYRWVGDRCKITRSGTAITEHDFLPRRLLGEYLEWFYETLVASAPLGVAITRHASAAVDITLGPNGKEAIHLADGTSVVVDHAVLTTGHTANLDHPARFSPAYPIGRHSSADIAGLPVGVAGMGLVAIDVVAALTVGRGGSFADDGRRLRYLPSGKEPVVHLFSRGGLPFCAKPDGAADETDDYELAICTAEAVASLRRSASGGTRQFDARHELLPLIFAEMQVRYYSQAAALREGRPAATTVRNELAGAHRTGRFHEALLPHTRRFGDFDPGEHLFRDLSNGLVSSKDYEGQVYDMIEADLEEALRPHGQSPLKSAYEVLRFVRDPMRSAIEFSGLTHESFLDFRSNIRGRMTRIVAGPPTTRSKQLLALIDAGVLTIPFGPSPEIEPGSGDGLAVRSTALDNPVANEMAEMIQGFLDEPTLRRTASPLLQRLYQKGRLAQLSYSGSPVGSVALSESFHPVSESGIVQETLSVFGALTEGARFFTHYLPSPKSRLRAFLDAQRCVEEMLG